MEYFIRGVTCNGFNRLEGQGDDGSQIIHLNEISMLEYDPRREVFPERGEGEVCMLTPPSSFYLPLPLPPLLPLPIQFLDRLEQQSQ